MADDEDPYVVYQLRKPHQRGTAVVPRLVPKSHAPAFSHANYRFARVRPAADDSLLYLPKSLEYPTKWDSFGSESSIWSGSSLASAFPNRVPHILDQPSLPNGSGSRPAPFRRMNDDEETVSSNHASSTGRGPPSVASLTERTSILSSEGTRSLKSFIRFDAPFNAEALGALQAPVPIRRPFVAGGAEFGDPFMFVLPPALSEVEREDQIVQQVMENPSSVSSDTESSAFGEDSTSVVRRIPNRPRNESPDLRPTSSVKRRPGERIRTDTRTTPTRKRLSMWAWLFGGGEREKVHEKKHPNRRPESLRKKRHEDVAAAPIMDDEEERLRRAQFVKAGRRSKSSNRFGSWKRTRSVSVDSRRPRQRDRKNEGLGRTSSARRLWNSFKRSASFTFGSKKHFPTEEKKPGAPAGERTGTGLDQFESKRQDSTLDQKVNPNDSFVRRKIQFLRDTTSRRMAAAADEIGKAPSQHSSSQHSSRRKDPAVHPSERREDRPRSTRNVPATTGAAVRSGMSAGRIPAFSSMAPGATMSTLDQMIAARPELQSATTESVENLASRINSDLSYGTGFTSLSERTGSNSAFNSGPINFDGYRSYGNHVRDPAVHSSAVSSAPSSDAFSESSFRPSLQSIICEEAPSPIAQWRPPSRSGNSSSGRSDSGSTDLRLSNTSKQSIEAMKARVGWKEPAPDVAARNASTSPVSAIVAGNSIFLDTGLVKKRSTSTNAEGATGTKQGDFSDPHATQLDVYCQCSCSCVYEEDCIQACEGKSSKGVTAAATTLSMSEEEKRRTKSRLRETERVRQQCDYSPTAESPSLGVLNGARKEKTRRNISHEDWQHTLRKRFPMNEGDNSYGSLGGDTGSADPPLHSVEEIRGSVRNPGGFTFETPGGNDWSSRYGKGHRAQENTAAAVPVKREKHERPVSYNAQEKLRETVGKDSRVSVPAVRTAVPLREEYPSAEYKSGVPVQRMGGDPNVQKAGRTRHAEHTPEQLHAALKSPLSQVVDAKMDAEQPGLVHRKSGQRKQRPASTRAQPPKLVEEFAPEKAHQQWVSAYRAVRENDLLPEKSRARPRATAPAHAVMPEEGAMPARRGIGAPQKARTGRGPAPKENRPRTEEERKENGRYPRERAGRNGAVERTQKAPVTRGTRAAPRAVPRNGPKEADTKRNGRGLVGMFIRKARRRGDHGP